MNYNTINNLTANILCKDTLNAEVIIIRPKKRFFFVSCNGLKKNRVGRSVKKDFFALFFWSKMCVLSGTIYFK